MSDVVSGVELAGYINVLPSTVSDLAAKDRVVRIGRGKYDLKASTRRYCDHLKEAAAGRPGTKDELNTHKARLTKAQADTAEMIREQRAGRMADVKMFEHRWAAEMVALRQALLGLATSIAEDLQLNKHETHRVDEIVRRMMSRLADEAEEKISLPEGPAAAG